MRALTATSLTSLAAAAAALLLAAGAAEAACKKMAFLVNDYGKDGPSKDAQDLLDKHVAEWAGQNGIKNYTVGKKDVTCELFLNFIVFDEHTCTATANVCWDEPGKEAPAKTADKSKPVTSEKPAAADKKSSAKVDAPTVEKVVEKAPAAAPAIETGTLPAETTPPAAAPATAGDDAAARAAAAAERAAQAAERAAAAAERAAAAAKTASPSQLEMPAFGAGKPVDVAPVTPVEPKS